MTDLDRKLEEIAQKFYRSDCQCDECLRELVQATTEATARYCAAIAQNEPIKEPADVNGMIRIYGPKIMRQKISAAILRECGVKE